MSSEASGIPDTWFAAAERADDNELKNAVRDISNSELMTALLRVSGGILAVLNEQRQILALNSRLLEFMGVDDPIHVLGLRPGEALNCAHAKDHPGGCGTSKFCRTCGAAVAIVAALADDEPVERECLLMTEGVAPDAIELRVRAVPLDLDGRKLILVLLQDIRNEKRLQALERVFFHDVMNTLAAATTFGEILNHQPERAVDLAPNLQVLLQRLAAEIKSQQLLHAVEADEYQLSPEPLAAEDVLVALRDQFAPMAERAGVRLRVRPPTANTVITTDELLLKRVLGNMIKNAIEATGAGQEVHVWLELGDDDVSWQVSNPGCMPDAVALRVFQRYFTTKPEAGRGLGTYSMKLLGEDYLDGRVSFTTDEEAGTVFRFRLPLKPACCEWT